nr:MAG TPA_asm: hypothetical protein [Caudoviricetes sp.]
MSVLLFLLAYYIHLVTSCVKPFRKLGIILVMNFSFFA